MKKARSISDRMSLRLLKATMLLFFGCIAAITAVTSNSIKKTAQENAQNLLEKVITDIEGVLSETETAAENMIWVAKEHLDDPDYMFHITQEFVSQNERIIGSTIAFEPNYFAEKGEYYAPYTCIDKETGDMQSFQMGGNDYDYFTMEWYQLPLLLKQNIWCEPYFDEGGGNQMMTTYSIPLWDEKTNEVFAVLTADISLMHLTDIIEGIRPYEDSYTVLVGRAGSYISHPDPKFVLNQTVFTLAKQLGSDALYKVGLDMVNHRSGMTSLRMEKKNSYFVVYDALTNGWSVALFCPTKEILEQLNNTTNMTILIAILSMLILFYITRRIIRRNTQPITEFAFTALNIAKGNFNVEIPEVTTNDEIKQLHDALQYMLSSVNAYIDELKTTTASKEKYESELYIASAIQKQMVPSDFPPEKEYDLYAMLNPAKVVGGDLYDFMRKDDRLYFTIGDVSGKGVPAALYMALTNAIYRLIINMNYDLDKAMTLINNSISRGNTSNMFVTMFSGYIDFNTLEMTYCNGGHNPVVIVDPDGKATLLKAKPNMAVGIFGGFDYVKENLTLRKGSRLLIYTDGVTEAENTAKELYGEERLLAFCSKEPVTTSSKDFIDDLLSDVRSFTAGNEQNDDITIMSILF